MKNIIKFIQNKYFVITLLVVVALYLEYKFVDTFKFQSVVKVFKLEFQAPVVPRDKGQSLLPVFQVQAQTVDLTGKENTSAKIEVPVSTNPRDIILAQKHGQELLRVFQLETQSGKADNCKEDGKFGGFGVKYKTDKGEHLLVCSDTFERAVKNAEWNWNNNATRYPNATLDELLCYWNTGTIQPMCKYSMDYYVAPTL